MDVFTIKMCLVSNAVGLGLDDAEVVLTLAMERRR
jgi:hypothetical protein